MLHRFMTNLSKAMAILGGAVLAILIVMVCLSIFGRTLNGWLHGPLFDGALQGVADGLLALGIGPVTGDFELVEAGMAFAIFAFLPICQISGGHASVDVFTNYLPIRAQKALRMIIEIIFAVVLVVIALQLKEGLDSKMRSGTTTFLLQFPIWWGYACALLGAAVAAIVGVYMGLVRVVEFVTGRDIAGNELGAHH
jgi:TRAP-type C4-dicarboxylate transport system permease small subunit